MDRAPADNFAVSYRVPATILIQQDSVSSDGHGERHKYGFSIFPLVSDERRKIKGRVPSYGEAKSRRIEVKQESFGKTFSMAQ